MKRIAAIVVTLLAAACTESAPPSTVSGGERQVNTYTLNAQQRPAAASNGQGQSIIVWESYGQDGSHFGIFGQRFSQGQPTGNEFQINSYTVGRQSMPAVAMDSGGNFVVVWRSSLQQGPGGTIYGQRFNANGTRAGNEFRIGPNNSNRDSQADPTVAMNATGEFAVAWSNRELGALDTATGQNQNEELFLQLRAYTAAGAARNLQPVTFTVRESDRAPRAPRMSMDAAGNFVVTWIGGNETTAAIRVRHFGSNGQPSSEAYDVSEARTDAAIDLPVVAMTPSGQFAVAWEASTFGNAPMGIFFRRYSGPQAAIGPAVILTAPSSAGLVERAAITVNTDGSYFVVAQAEDHINLTRVGTDGAIRAPARASNSRFAAMFPTITYSGNDTLVIAWQSLGQDGSDRGIYAREAKLR